jgi:KUP system potassium uptake protein
MGEIFDEPIDGTTTILEDNHSAIAYSHNAHVSDETKHIDLKWHFLKAHVEEGTVILLYLPTDRVVADMFTKPLPGPALARHRSAISGGAYPMQRIIP